MTTYQVDTQGVRSVLTAVGSEGEGLAEVRASTSSTMDDAAASCGQGGGVAAAVRRARDVVHDGQDAIERHVASCVAALVEATVAYEVADAAMAVDARAARASAGDAWEGW